jgi:TnpA family transposase
MNKNKKSDRLSILSPLEEFAFYGFPDFDHEQRATHFEFGESEWKVILKCPSLQTKVYCALKIGYFKAKNTFFRFSLHKIPQADVNFILAQYFQNQRLDIFTITKHEYYLQRKAISHLFGYQTWSNEFLTQLKDRARLSVKRDISPNFVAYELLTFLQNEKIVRPGYSTLQTIVSQVLTEERYRLKVCFKNHLTESHKQSLNQLLKNESTISELAALKQDAKSFGSTMMSIERKKHATLKPLYDIAKMMMQYLDISQQNVAHYASLAHHYTIYDLDRFDDEQTYLYLLCYVFKRYQQINDNLIDAFDFNVKKLEKEIKKKADSHLADDQEKVDRNIGRLLLLYVDEDLSDSMTLGDTRKLAFEILPKASIRSIGEKMLKKTHRKQVIQWKERDKALSRYKHNLRPLFMKIDFESKLPDNPLLKAIGWMKSVFAKQQSLSQQAFDEFPREFISKRLDPYLLTADKNITFQANRYEIQVYRQIIKQMQTGAIHIEDSICHRTFSHELVSLEEKENILKNLDIPWLKTSCEKQLDSLFKELDTLWNQFDYKLKQGTLKHLKYDHRKKEVLWVKPKSKNGEDQGEKQTLYDKLPIYDIADVLRFVNKKSDFLSSLTPLQPRYKKQKTDEDHLIAVMTAQAMNIGNYKMAQTSDISYSILESTYQQYMRLSTLKKAHDRIANAITHLSIFPHYTFDLDVLYGSLDGQKYETVTPTARARYSRKYYKKGRGVVAYTLLSNHVPIQCELIGAHEHESHFVFDIWYGNTSIIQPMVITGDMHSVNKANFALLHWFGGELRPRFTNLKKELNNAFCGKDPENYQRFLVQPVGQINRQLILDEKKNIDQVVATLALKEMSQSTLVRKLCALSPQNNTRKAIFEFNRLTRSIYILKCILNPTILLYVHRSQNRIESYHNLRASISKISGGKALLGRTDIEVEISNQCGRLIAVAIIYYNSSIQSRLLEKTDENNKKQLKFLKNKMSPVAWQHLHFTGHFTFYDKKYNIDIDKIIENINIL